MTPEPGTEPGPHGYQMNQRIKNVELQIACLANARQTRNRTQLAIR